MFNPYVNIAWGVGRSQFAAAWPEIKAHMDSRLSLKSMYRKLRDADRIQMSYRRFCQLYVEQMRNIQEEIGNTITKEAHVEKSKPSMPAKTQIPAPAVSQTPVQRTGPKLVQPMEPKPFKQSEVSDYREII